MATLNEYKRQFFSEALGEAGPLPSLEKKWLEQETGAKGAINELWMEYLGQQGFTDASLSQRMFKWLRFNGYTAGDINTMLYYYFRGDKESVSFSDVKTTLKTGGNATILVIGDSTGTETFEWVYRVSQWLAEQNPNTTVNYYLWDEVAGDYDTANIIQVGNSNTLNVYNFSIGGATAMAVQGANFANAVDAIDPDLVVWNHGHNHAVSPTLAPSELRTPMDQVRLAKPNAAHAAFLQNPKQDNNSMAPIIEVWQDIVEDRPDLLLLDAYTPFIDAGKPLDWYLPADTTHPSELGQTAFVSAFQQAWNSSRASSDFDPGIAWMLGAAENVLINGELESTGTDVPTGWTAGGTVAFARDESIVYPGKDSSLQMTGSGAAAARIFQALNLTQRDMVRGQTVFLTVISYVPEGADNTMGRISLSCNGTGGSSQTSRATVVSQGGWKILGVGPMYIPEDVTVVSLSLYVDTDATPDTEPVNYQLACLSVGTVPRGLSDA